MVDLSLAAREGGRPAGRAQEPRGVLSRHGLGRTRPRHAAARRPPRRPPRRRNARGRAHAGGTGLGRRVLRSHRRPPCLLRGETRLTTIQSGRSETERWPQADVLLMQSRPEVLRCKQGSSKGNEFYSPSRRGGLAVKTLSASNSIVRFQEEHTFADSALSSRGLFRTRCEDALVRKVIELGV